MDSWLWEGLGTAVVAAAVAFGTTMLIRWLDARRVRWLVTGHARTVIADKDDKPGQVQINLEVHNIGNGDAYDVRLRRCNGANFLSWVTFERGKVAAGDSFEVTFTCSSDTWETAWMEVISRTTLRAQASKPTASKRVLLRTATGPKDQQRWHDPRGRGLDLPQEEGGRLR